MRLRALILTFFRTTDVDFHRVKALEQPIIATEIELTSSIASAYYHSIAKLTEGILGHSRTSRGYRLLVGASVKVFLGNWGKPNVPVGLGGCSRMHSEALKSKHLHLQGLSEGDKQSQTKSMGLQAHRSDQPFL